MIRPGIVRFCGEIRCINNWTRFEGVILFNDAVGMGLPNATRAKAKVQFEALSVSSIFWMFVALSATDIVMMQSFRAVTAALLLCLYEDFCIRFSLRSPIQALPSPKHCLLHHRQTIMFSLPAWAGFGPNPSDSRHIVPIINYKNNITNNSIHYWHIEKIA